jgi:hypothetical protein
MKKLTETRGQALVEFALIFPLQLMIVMCILEVSMILVGRSVVSYAAYCAAHAEVLGQDPQEAASIALIPLGDPTAPFAVPPGQQQAQSDALPGWGYQPKWSDVRGKVKVYRLYNDNSRVLNRVDIHQDVDEYHRTRFVSQHNVGVEVEYPLKLLLPLSFFEIFVPEEQATDFRAIEDRTLVNINGELYFVLREKCLLPARDRLINTKLELRQAEQEYEYGGHD